MLGDCLHCGASFELSEEQEREVRRLLEGRTQAATLQAAPIPQQAPAQIRAIQIAKRPPPIPLSRRAAPVPATRPLVVVEKAFSWADLFRELPAWLVSMVVHIVLIILLALWIPRQDDAESRIVLSAVMGFRHQEGERGKPDPVVDEVELADPGQTKPKEPLDLPKEPPKTLEELDAAELLPRPNEQTDLPALSHVLTAFERPSEERMFEGRDPRACGRRKPGRRDHPHRSCGCPRIALDC